jgi:acid phosphatase type 7
MDRRTFLSSSTSVGIASVIGALSVPAAEPVTSEFTAGSEPGPVFAGSPVISGPAHDSITILQPLARTATGHLEFAVEDGPFQRVDAESAGLLPVEQNVLKFRLPPLPAGKQVRFRTIARSIGWVRVQEFVHGEVRASDLQESELHSFRTLNPNADATTFAVWNDTHENAATLKSLHEKTAAIKPDFLVWNGDQTNDVHFEKDMAGQFLTPAGLAIADSWPLAYVRGNHDVRGPEAHRVPQFTGTPNDQFYYAFRSGPLAALVMDTGEDKPDDSPNFAGMAAFQVMQRRQASWLKSVTRYSWFQSAPFKILFCHIPLYFTRDIFPTHQRWECHNVCRELWVPTLVEAGVKLIISGHTHDHRWMPAKDGQPIAQLIGGAPQYQHATLIQGTVTREILKVEMSSLDGTVVADVQLKT